MIGHKIKFQVKHDQKIADIEQNVDQKEDEFAKIGHSIEKSETLFPQGFVDPKTNIIYCDCPGFLDSRDLEEKIAVAINLELAIKNSTNVKAIIIAINFNELYATRGESFKSLYKILDRLVNDIEKVGTQLIFVITRCSNYTPDGFLSYINELLTSNSTALKDLGLKYVGKLKNLVKSDEKKEKKMKEKERILKLLNIIKENPKNVVIGDLTNKHCRDKIVSIITSSNISIPKTSFSFESYDENRNMFDDFINMKIYESVKHLRRVVSKPAEIKDIENQLDECVSKIEFYNSEIKKIINIMNGNVVEDIEEEVKKYQQIYAENQKKLDSIKIKLEENNSKIELYNEELDELNSEEPYLVKTWTYFDKRLKLVGGMTKSNKKFKYLNPLTPILKVEKFCERGI